MSREIVQSLKFKKPSPGFDANEFGRLLEEAYLKERRESKHTKKVSFSPSSIGYGNGTCPRYWYLAFEGSDFVETTDALGIANMMNGSAAHDRIQKVLEQTGVLVDTEVEMKMTDPPVRGYIDVLIRWDGEIVVGEIKTTRQESFNIRRSEMKPMGNHLFQILLYMKATGKRNGFLFYENKNSQEFLIIPVEMTEKNEKILENALNWMRAVHKNWSEDKLLPMRPFTKKSVPCKGCPVFNECWENRPAGEIELAPMEVPK